MRRERVRIGVLALASSALMVIERPASAAAQLSNASAAVSSGAIFNHPSSTSVAAKERIRTHLLGLINGAPRGAVIRVALYRLNDAALVDAASAADARGVAVRLVLDGKNAGTKSYLALRSALGTNTSSGSWVKLCPKDRGCLKTGINHNKFWLFSTTRGTKRVLVQTSSNMNSYSYAHQWNSAYTYAAGTRASGAPATAYETFRGYFEGLTARSYSRFRYSQAVGKDRTYFFPQRAGAPGDPVVNILNKVTCVDPKTRARSSIRIAMYTWTRGALADKVMQKVRAGCRVWVNYTMLSSAVWTKLHPSSGPRPTMSCYVRRNATGHPIAYVHSKYLLIDGRYGGVSRQKLVLSGSPNYTATALSQNDEAMLRTSTGYAGFLSNFTQMSVNATPGRNENKSLCLGQPFR